jgi:hypothetical protein
LQERIGIWGDRCLVAPDGSPYLEPEDSRVVEEFWYWTLPENQDYARRFEGRWPPFSMAIPATTTLEVLSRTYDLQSDEVGEFYYYNYIEGISYVIDELKWAYIPVYGNDYAIFVAGSHGESIVDAVSENLSKAGVRNIFSVTQDTAAQHWNGPQVWSDH